MFLKVLGCNPSKYRMKTYGNMIPINHNARKNHPAILNAHKEKSMRWLLDALAAKKHCGVTDLDVVKESIDSMRIQLNNLETFFVALEQRICLIEQFARDLEQRTSTVESQVRESKPRK